MKRSEFASALRKQTEVHVSSGLRQKTLDAAYGKEKMMKKKRIPALALAVVLSVVFCATALAIAARTGMLDYQNLFYNTYIPENAAEFIEQDVHQTANDLVDISIRELYYDGRTSRITVDVKAKDESILLAGFDTWGGGLWSDINRLNPEFDESDTRTVAEVFAQGDYTASYNVNISLFSEDSHSGSGDYFYTAPGVLTFFLTDSYETDLPEREVTFRVSLTPFIDKEGDPIKNAEDQRIRTEEKLTLTSSTAEEKVYVSDAPAVLSEIGVTVDQMQLFVKPQELYVRLYYTVEANEVNGEFITVYSDENGEPVGGRTVRDVLALELFNPAIVTDDPYAQRLTEGLTGHVATWLLSEEGALPEKYISEFTLGLNELTDSYFVRAFNFDSKVFYDSAEITMREATAEEIEALQEAK